MRFDLVRTSPPSLRLDANDRAAAIARAHVRAFCHRLGHPRACDSATVVVSELVTNAVRHARTDITVTCSVDDRFLRVEVRDWSPQEPAARAAGVFDEGGRGLMIVDHLAANWGVDVTGTTKVVWAEIAL